MTDSRKAIALILATAIAVPMEGLRQKAYKDVTGLPTICFGSTENVKMTDVRTSDECRVLLDDEMKRVIDTVDRCVPNLDSAVLAAFADASYNIGEKIACDPSRSTAARKLKAGDIEGACNELPRWNKATVAGQLVELPGLTKRRIMERDLCLKGVSNMGKQRGGL